MKVQKAALLCSFALALPLAARKPPAAPAPQNLEEYVKEVNQRWHQSLTPTPGSLFLPNGRLTDIARDVRASQIYDLVTIVVTDNSTATSTGATNTQRKSSLAASVTSLAGKKSAAGALANLADTSNSAQLQGQGSTSRGTTLSTTVTAEVIALLPNGNLVVRGQKDITVNGEKQVITVQGIVRPDDLSPVNSVPSNDIARMEIQVNGKGMVNDAVKRPFFLYRILMGLLPF